MITPELIKALPDGKAFASGTVFNSPEGVYMTSTRKGDLLKWIAKKGHANDWAIYIYWAELDDSFILDHGDKITSDKFIQFVIQCTPEALKLYRR